MITQILTKNSSENHFDFNEGVLILVDKPAEWTSFDVVNKIRFKLKYALGVKKIKVGHAGTLDPLATGLLLICTGKYTKLLDELQGMSKVYSGIIQLGATTPTFDQESDPDQIFPVDHISEEAVAKVTQAYIGAYAQFPPIYSAIKQKGQKLYQLARRGIDIELKPRQVIIHDFVSEFKGNHQIDFTVDCGKGTYIRSLAHDVGKSLGSGAYLAYLRRESIGIYHVDQAMNLDEIINFIENQGSLKR